MNIIDKLQSIPNRVKIIVGLILIAIGFFTGISWFYIGIIPVIFGITNFCPICTFMNRCPIKFKK